jgi:HAD superfamily hydrolase (TIGR01662 family)
MIPWTRLDTLTLDVGNTLISVDFEHISERLAHHGIAVSADALRRAEAAARPALSQQFAGPRPEGAPEPFDVYLHGMLSHLPVPPWAGDGALVEFVARAAPAIRGARSSALWRAVMPHVPEALARLHAMGLRLVVVSNSDGTVEDALVAAGLRDWMTAVLDSAVVGYEKPDPRIFAEALGRTGADPARTLHVGDLYHADVVGARAAGLHAVLLDPFGDWHDVDCERVPDLRAVAERIAAARTTRGDGA